MATFLTMDDAGERRSTLWTLHVGPAGDQELWVSCLLGPAFGEQSTSMSDSFSADRMGPEATAACQNLYAEVAGSFPPPAPVPTPRGLRMKIVERLHVTHCVDPWPGQEEPAVIQLTRERVDGPNPGAVRNVLQLRGLSAISRQAIAIVDEFALAASRRFIDEYATRAVGQPIPDAAPPSRSRIFISYRRGHLELARTLHRALAGYGGGAFFDPYLDEHDLAAGEMERRFRDAISKSDLFLAIATATYAEAGSWSARELEIAVSERRLIVPLLIGDARPEAWPGWKQYASRFIASDADLTPGSPALDALATLCIRGVQAA